MSRVVVLAGEGEYSSERTMRLLAEDLAARHAGVELDYRVADVLADYPAFPQSSFGDLRALRGADLLVVYTRFRILPDEETAELAAYVERGGNVLGLRTSTHAFHFAEDSPWAGWNDGFGRDVLGSPWISHHGHSSRTRVRRVAGADHPVLADIPDEFDVRSWLYRVDLQPGCRPLLHGHPVEAEDIPTPGPVAWVRERAAHRTFFTSLGHPEDFTQPAFRRLLVNGALWCLGADTAEEGR